MGSARVVVATVGLRRSAATLFWPWGTLLTSFATTRLKSIIRGVLASSILLYGGWLLLVPKDDLSNRSVVMTLLAPDSGPKSSGLPLGKLQFEKTPREKALNLLLDHLIPDVDKFLVPVGIIASLQVGLLTYRRSYLKNADDH